MLYLFNFPTPAQPIRVSGVHNIFLEKITDVAEIEFLKSSFMRHGTISELNELDFERITRINFDGNESLSVLRSQGLDSIAHAERIARKNEIRDLMNVFLFALPRGAIRLPELIELEYLVDLWDINSIQVRYLERVKILSTVVNPPTPDAVALMESDYEKITKTIAQQNSFLELHSANDEYVKNGIVINHIGENLELYKQAGNSKIKFGILIGIAEALLCKGRDDLTRQFCFKFSIAIERIQRLVAFEQINRIGESQVFFHEIYHDRNRLPGMLSIIYDIRSKIVHGRQREIDLVLRKFVQLRGSSAGEISFDGTVFPFLEQMVAALVNLALEDPGYVAFIREGWAEKN